MDTYNIYSYLIYKLLISIILLLKKYILLTNCGCPISWSVQSHAGRGFVQPHLVKDVSAHGRGVGLRDL